MKKLNIGGVIQPHEEMDTDMINVKDCEVCRKKLEGLQRKHCSRKCARINWTKNNKDKDRERHKIYYQNNKEEIINRERERRRNDPGGRERDKISWKKYYEKNKKNLSEKGKEYRSKHLEHLKWLKKIESSTHRAILNYFRDECGICHTKEGILIHHWRYRLPVRRADFSVVCNSCHQIIHHIENKSRGVERVGC